MLCPSAALAPAAAEHNYCVTSQHLARIMAMTVSSSFAGTIAGNTSSKLKHWLTNDSEHLCVQTIAAASAAALSLAAS